MKQPTKISWDRHALTDGPCAMSRVEMPPPPDRAQRDASAYALPTDI